MRAVALCAAWCCTSPGDLNAGNGGGGGGGLGRIVIHAPAFDQIKSSPTATTL